jgi:methyltransferase family protein
MSFGTEAKKLANRLLSRCNVQINSCTAERREADRLAALSHKGHFDKAVFPVLPQFQNCDPAPIFQTISGTALGFAEIVDRSSNGFSLQNDYYSTPDAETLYAMIQLYRPEQVIEVGSGNSTRLFRCGIEDGRLNTQLTSVDPNPQCEVGKICDRVICERVENLSPLTLFQSLKANDILFIDSSHEVAVGNDVVFLFLNILPMLAKHVLIHIHDIFLPFEYPEQWIKSRWVWTEQYLLQALLTDSQSFEVLWPGHYLQRSQANFSSYFRHWDSSVARSLWLRKT